LPTSAFSRRSRCRSPGGAFYRDIGAIREAIHQRGSFNVIHLATMFKVDLFIPKDRPFDRQQLDRRQSWIADRDSGRTIYVASPEDTILTKLAWYRLGDEVSEHQWRDTLGVLVVQGDRLDLTYMGHWPALGVICWNVHVTRREIPGTPPTRSPTGCRGPRFERCRHGRRHR
jgi:hypothetical protein